MSNILKYQNPSSPLLNPHKIIENIPAREWGPYKINEDYTVTEGKGTNFLRTPFQYWGKKGLGLQNEKLARDLISDFDKMKKENPDYDYTLDKNYKAYEGAVHYIDHLEGLKKYLGLPYDTSALVESAYKPTRLQGTNEKTYKFKSSTAPGYWNSTVEDMIMGEYDKRGGYYDQSLNEYTAYRDRDEKGDFISIYDEWDYNPAVRGGNKKLNKVIDFVTGGTPFVIYDRIYLDDYYDIPKEARGNPFITPAVVTAYKKGGRIHIKKKNRGKFTAAAKRAGMGVQEFARHVLANKDKYSSTLVKRANFARNSKKFKHENGGILKYQNPAGPFLELKDTLNTNYLTFKKTLPDNLRLTPEKDYHMYDYWRLSGEPKNFREGKRRGMFTWDRSDKGYHAGSIAEDRNTGIYHFMKPKHHPTVKYELDWFNKGLQTLEGGKQVPVEGKDKEFWEDFTSKYQLDTTGVDYRYVPIKKNGGILKALDYANYITKKPIY